jgi:hypothetical protein
MFRRTTILAVTLVVAGCAQGTAGSATTPPAGPAPSLSAPPSASSAPPTAASPSPGASSRHVPATPSVPLIDRRPSGPPRGPTDTIKKTSWVVGTVTVGGDGPCYRLVTDDGVKYALHATTGTTLTKGTRVEVNTAPSRLKIYCGPGKLVEMLAVKPLR